VAARGQLDARQDPDVFWQIVRREKIRRGGRSLKDLSRLDREALKQILTQKPAMADASRDRARRRSPRRLAPQRRVAEIRAFAPHPRPGS
jgi:hypothetical protein